MEGEVRPRAAVASLCQSNHLGELTGSCSFLVDSNRLIQVPVYIVTS